MLDAWAALNFVRLSSIVPTVPAPCIQLGLEIAAVVMSSCLWNAIFVFGPILFQQFDRAMVAGRC
jgi:hypothetical protein